MSPVFLDQMFTRKLFAFAGNTVLVYDYLLTLSLEVAYIWNAPWTVVKVLFLINRYGNLIGQTFIMLEETGYLSQNSQEVYLSCFCVTCRAQSYISFVRAFQLYCTSFSVLSGESIRLILGVSLYWVKNLGLLQSKYLTVNGVCFSPTPSNAWRLWLLPLFFDGLMLAIVCGSLYRLSRWSPGCRPSRLVSLLARDAFLFYFAALFNVVFFIVCWYVDFARHPVVQISLENI
ncbi:hypothetical protein J3R83DRAFT_8560 [Lanmaoa asiatica]|nr:hypothetical protein J3R83DRAFT_8560 [Lanmaoa asiatica]